MYVVICHMITSLNEERSSTFNSNDKSSISTYFSFLFLAKQSSGLCSFYLAFGLLSCIQDEPKSWPSYLNDA